jgi:xylose isomerase
LIIIGRQDWNDLDHDHKKQIKDEVVFVFEKLKDYGLTPGGIDFMGVDQSQAAQQVDKIEASVKGIESCTIDILEIPPIPGEVVVGVG